MNSPDDLYKLLTGRGYSVDISKHDAYGDVIFYVTIPGYPQDAYLLTVGLQLWAQLQLRSPGDLCPAL